MKDKICFAKDLYCLFNSRLFLFITESEQTSDLETWAENHIYLEFNIFSLDPFFTFISTNDNEYFFFMYSSDVISF